jgi:ribosomal protein L14
MKSNNINVTIIWKNGNIRKFDCDSIEFRENSIFIITKNGEKRYASITNFKLCTIDIEGNA